MTASLVQDRPRYSTIADALARQIESGELAPGAQLLGERELSKRFDASRVTLRRALIELRDRGLIDSDSTRGWFVSSTFVGEPNALMSFSEMALARGLKPGSRVVSSQTRAASLEDADDLRVAPGSELFELTRVRLLDEVAVGLERSRIPLRLVPAFPGLDFSMASLYAELDRAGLRPHAAEYAIQAVGATAAEAALLGVAEGAPLLLARAATRLKDGRPVELSRSVFLGERYRFYATLFRPRR